MNVNAIVATLEGCSFEALNDAALLHRVLTEAVEAGRFTELHRYVHVFEPQGLTGAVVLSESHIAVHTWPENGVFFVDIASCSGEVSARAAFESICRNIPHALVKKDNLAYDCRAELMRTKVG
jgi:S-adenosylmethionine decarboxylase